MAGLKRKFDNFLSWYLENYRGKKGEINKFKDPRRVAISSKIDLTAEQKQEIDEFYLSNYGAKIPYTWHRHFYAMSGKFDKKYFPELLFIPEYEWLMNPREYTYALADKNITPTLLFKGVSGLSIPESIISCSNGLYRDDKLRPITLERAVQIADNCGKAFLKPTVDSCSGKGCGVVELHNGVDEISGKFAMDIVKQAGNNFALQRCIECHESVKKLHPESVNTFRVITYITPSKQIHHTPVIMRIGQGNNCLDNAHAGGMFVGVHDNGDLLEYATTEFNNKYYEHPNSNIKLVQYKISLVTNAISKAEELHAMIPQIGVINWDFTIDKDGLPLLIEINLRGGSIWLPQMAWGCGPFGDDTEEILHFLREMKKKYPFSWR